MYTVIWQHSRIFTRAPLLASLCLMGLSIMIGCTTKDTVTNALIQSMRERGPLVLSSDNPYLAPNEFVYQVQSESESVRGFLDSQGIPDAIVVTGSPLAADVIQFLYVAPDEAFTLENIDTRWVIVGPQEFPRPFKSSVKKSVRRRGGPPAIIGSEAASNAGKGSIYAEIPPTAERIEPTSITSDVTPPPTPVPKLKRA